MRVRETVMRGACALMAALLVLMAGPGALAEAYSFPYAGVKLAAQEGWTVLVPETLEEEAALLSQLGADLDTLRADYAANHTVFEVYLPEGIQVSLNAVATEQTVAWGSMSSMPAGDQEAFLQAYSAAPYEHAAWSETQPGYLRCDWTLQAGGIPVSFAGLVTVRQGMQYTLVASGASAPVEAMHAANEQVLAQLTYQGMSAEAASISTGIASPTRIEDDGVTTPLEMVDFSVLTYDDTTNLYLHTLPGTELILRTATDSLRGRADEEGMHRFQVSTKRETVYTYTVVAQAEGRTASEIEISVERQLTAEEQDAAYRRSARQISYYGYGNLVGAPESFEGQAITFRGRVGEFAELGGFPCVLIYTENPGKGVWRTPMWVMLTEAVALSEGDIRTVYGDLRGDTLPYVDENGDTQQAPVVISRGIAE